MTDVHERLVGFWGTFGAQWDSTRAVWRDGVALRFEREYWLELETEMPKLLAALEELEESLATTRMESD